MKINYFLGRALQLIGLLALPSAIWIAEFEKSEAGAILVFLGSLVIFFVGWILTKVG
ncbi:MAG: hypothetical protein HY447_03040 [Candidatus Omnitrophica bacterium]|nr:hypothetical protein [Candidatus Omnitrophota bacterium]